MRIVQTLLHQQIEKFFMFKAEFTNSFKSYWVNHSVYQLEIR